MLETVGSYAEAQFDAPQIFQLTPDVCLVVWDPPHPVNASPRLEERTGRRFASVASVRLARLDGRSRLLWIFSLKEKSPLQLRLSAGAVGSAAELGVRMDQEPAAADPYALTNGLSQNACAVLVTTMLNTWSGIFRVGRSRRFVGFAMDLLRSINETPSVADCVASIGATRLLETFLNGDCAEISSAVIVSSQGVKRVSGNCCNVEYGGRKRLYISSVELESVPEKGFLVLSGSWGLAIRKLETENAWRSLGQWWAGNSRKLPEARDYLVSELGARSLSARAAVVDLQISEPLPAKRHGILGDASPFCAVETALAGAGGVLVGGWLRDPAGTYAGIDVLDPSGNPLPLDLRFFDGVLPETQGGYRIKRFVAYAHVGNSLQNHLQPRFDLRMASGEKCGLVPPPQPQDFGEFRAKALSVITPRHATDDVIETCLAPPFADIQARLSRSIGEPAEVTIGTPVADPTASIIIPVYRVLEFLKTQIASFAADRWLQENAEVLFVLDSPEQATQVEDLLAGFHLLYGLPMRLIVMGRNGGYSHANNVGASKARGRYLAMINSDVVPVEAGWLEQLCACLMMNDEAGIVGGKLLYADNAIQHAGLKFIQDEKGRWFNHHYFKGFPRHFPKASTSREVPGVTGACLVLSKADFEAAGGFTTDYVIGDYEDSDLCLKIRRLNRRIYYLGDVELYHFERISMKQNADYTRGVASQYNRWLHQSRWQEDIERLMSAPGAQEAMVTA